MVFGVLVSLIDLTPELMLYAQLMQGTIVSSKVKHTPLVAIVSPRGAEGLKAPCLGFAALSAFEEVLIMDMYFLSSLIIAIELDYSILILSRFLCFEADDVTMWYIPYCSKTAQFI